MQSVGGVFETEYSSVALSQEGVFVLLLGAECEPLKRGEHVQDALLLQAITIY
jgi:hypothetical protein